MIMLGWEGERVDLSRRVRFVCINDNMAYPHSLVDPIPSDLKSQLVI